MMKKNGTLEQYAEVCHGFFGRKGGVSDGIYDSLNCNAKTDGLANVMSNRTIVAERVGFQLKELKLMTQIHSNKVAIITHENKEDKVAVDAMVTKDRSILLAVQTADCCPVLFYDVKHHVIGAAHAGWRGAFSGVLQNTLQAMMSLGSTPQDVIAVLGPAIDKNNYEVDTDFKENFLHQSYDNQRYFSAHGEKFLFDLKEYALDILRAMNLKQVDNLAIDTYSREEEYFSYRRATHQDTAKLGSVGQLSVIGLK